MKNDKHADIFVIDDNTLDIMVSKLLINRVDNHLSVISNDKPKDALEQLKKISREDATNLPDYILLDINMDKMTGWNFLKSYAHQGLDKLKHIHIFVVSSSLAKEDITKAKLNPLVEGYITKPLSVEKIKGILGGEASFGQGITGQG